MQSWGRKSRVHGFRISLELRHDRIYESYGFKALEIVLGRKRELDVAEAVEHLPQVARAGEHVGARVVAD
jgi:hypothetical protein